MSGDPSEGDVRDARSRKRFELSAGDYTAVLEYRVDRHRLRLIHTAVPDPVQGEGLGSQLVQFALESARDRGLAVWPDCPFVTEYIRRNPEYIELVDERYPGLDELDGDGDED
jgi:predicted GNAT family acetyltransferase